jgi:tRNA G18 (ribose-2'-O)-methylase SpoU
MHIEPVEDLSAPDLAPFLTLRRAQIPFQQGFFVAEGRIVVERALQSPYKLRSILATPKRAEELRALIEARPESLRVYVAARERLEEVLGVNYHHGIMALGEIPQDPPLDELLAGPAPRLLVALDGLTQAENVGVIVRSAAGLGAAGVLAGETSCSPWLRRAVRNSMGGVFVVPSFHPKALAAELRRLKEVHGVRVVAADPQGAAPLEQYRFPPKCCLVMGSEFEGLSAAVRAECQDFVAIPLGRGIDSLNVGAAATVFLHAALKHP